MSSAENTGRRRTRRGAARRGTAERKTNYRNLRNPFPPARVWTDDRVAAVHEAALEVLETSTDDTVVFKFGNSKLWIDKVNTVSQAEIWLQVLTDDSAGADRLLNKAGIARCDEIEPLPDGFDGFWISNPASIVHLIDGAGSP